MFLARILDSWWKSPFFKHRRLLQTPEEVQQLIHSGIHEVEIDLSRGIDVASDLEEDQLNESLEPSSDSDAESSDSSIRQGLQEASLHPLPPSEREIKAHLRALRDDAVQAIEGVFEGVKTGMPLPHTTVQATAQNLVQGALAHPLVLAEVYLLEQLKGFDASLYAHVVDTAVLSLLVGMQLDWDPGGLEELAIAGLIHDIGYMRLPHNCIQDRSIEQGRASKVLQQHVELSMALLKPHAHSLPSILHMVQVHHERLDGSGYPDGCYASAVSEGGQVLGAIDYFDELTNRENMHGSFPVGLAIKKLYQDAKREKFSLQVVEALIRILGVYPVGTLVQLSSGEDGVVIKHNPNTSIKPMVKVLRDSEGRLLPEPEDRDLAQETTDESQVHITKILVGTDYPINFREIVDKV